ncbi:ABC transporter substrate-binding protein [Shewanella eurypsychrophilus]|uniref:ABC transporter substrate-binding protein n=1 Tax=Shewanella eurypsychrophilus TaxID=2593656 RepID=A0ABX6V160_9GAMM|nr:MULTISPECIES: ABC transporter substrate-binding protein [Shewanella]QPG56357.2 ABC transporter substrate-binding protein [Shewanella eurypsychrophilus]
MNASFTGLHVSLRAHLLACPHQLVGLIPYFRLLGLLTLTLILTACQPAQESPLRIASNTWPGYEPLYLARNLGHFDNTQVNLVEMTSASEVIHALRNHTIEGAALTLDEVLTVMEDGYDLKVILVMDFSNGGDVLLSKPDISSLAELKGKNIAVEYTAVGAILLNGALQAANLSAEDVNIIACSFDEHQFCYLHADAVVTFEPNRTSILALGANQLFDSSQIPGRIIDVLAVHTKTLESHPRALNQLISGYFKAIDYFNQQPLAAAELMKDRMRLTPSAILASYEGLHLPSLAENIDLLRGESSKLEEIATDLSSFMRQRKLLSHEVSVKAIGTDQFTLKVSP